MVIRRCNIFGYDGYFVYGMCCYDLEEYVDVNKAYMYNITKNYMMKAVGRGVRRNHVKGVFVTDTEITYKSVHSKDGYKIPVDKIFFSERVDDFGELTLYRPKHSYIVKHHEDRNIRPAIA